MIVGWLAAVAGPLAPAAVALATLAASGTAEAGVSAYGLRVGVVEARMHGVYGDDVAHDYRTGFAAGGWMRIPVRSGLSIQPELVWAGKGAEMDIEFGTVLAHVEHRLNYFELPVLARLDVPGNPVFQPYFVAGPSVSWCWDSDLRLEPGEGAPTPADPAPPSGASRVRWAQIYERVGTFPDLNFRDWDWGIVGGAGAVFGSGRLRTTIEVRYERGFVNVLPEDGDFAKNGAFIATVGLELNR